MSTTSPKLPDNFKQRAIAAAEKLGVSLQVFMVVAREQAVTAAERRAGFVAEALAVREQMLNTGKGYDADDVHEYLKSRIAGGKAPCRHLTRKTR